MRSSLYTSVLLATAAIGAASSLPAVAQESASPAPARADSGILEEIIVTARRRQERLQDVPISISVFDQTALDNANITNAGDLANYTPSLQVNTRFGGDTTTFSIRGFSQELRTTSSVGVYFAEVVAPRGANASASGDGAGPGDFFDLQNVQVLKGPQGTLFGRNTTGGAILITPQRPTDQLEGYVEGSAGNYDMLRGQAVINIPVTDRFRVRLGIDHNERDGHLDNFSNIGPDDFADVDYTAYRASAVFDITDSLENYTIARYNDSENNGFPGSLFYCNEEGNLGFLCQPDLDRRIANGNDGFYDVYNFIPDPVSEQQMLQVINTTTWDLNERYTIKNTLSYADLETKKRNSIYGTDWLLPTADGGTQQLIFQQESVSTSRPTTDQETFVWELQLQGRSFGERLDWQAGLYYEDSQPDGDYGSQSPTIISCIQSTVTSPNPEDFRCNQMLSPSAGAVASSPGGVEYTNKAIYAQGTWEFNDQWSTTAGIRYTDDETKGYVTEYVYKFPWERGGGYFPYTDILTETRNPRSDSDKPTWLLGVDYNPTEDVLLYGKYARGYRQGSVNIGGSTGLDTHGPEEVDNYEIGAKTSFFGRFPGNFNIAAFYNDFSDQQIQYGYFKTSGTGTTAILNAGSSTIWGIEVESAVQLFEGFVLSGSYTYLDTEVDELIIPALPPEAPLANLSTTTAEGEPLSYAPENKLSLTATYTLPFDADLGDMTASATYVYVDEMQAVSEDTSIYATLPDYDLINLNFSWSRMFGSPVDMSVFGTNVTDEEYITFLTGNWLTGLESGQVGMPRMYGVRFRYNFGD